MSDAAEPAEGTDPASWLAPRLSNGRTVGSLVPSGFDAYARVFHPAYQNGRERSWADIARERGRELAPGSTFESIAGVDPRYEAIPHDAPFDRGPTLGAPGGDLEHRLAAILENHTTTPSQVWFAVWVGYIDGVDKRFPTFELSFGREYLFASGSIGVRPSLGDIGHAADIWWPADRAWVVRSDTDLDSTWIGASSECVRQIVDSDLEAMELEFHEPVYDV